MRPIDGTFLDRHEIYLALGLRISHLVPQRGNHPSNKLNKRNMKLQYEKWAGWKIQAGFHRHQKADRITVRFGHDAISLLITGGDAAITPALELASVGAFGFVLGVAISTLI